MTKKVVSLLGYIAIIVVAVALVLCKIFASHSVVTLVFTKIAEACAFAVTAIVGFYFAREKKSIVWMIIFFLCAITVAVLLFI